MTVASIACSRAGSRISVVSAVISGILVLSFLGVIPGWPRSRAGGPGRECGWHDAHAR
ncbi:DUF3309 family protein [Komagataeibacter rhaeticus]